MLYSFRRCPYAIRARLALRYAGIACDLREVDLKDKPAEMLQASPKGTVPVMVINEGTPAEAIIEESLDIMLWALGQHDPDGWLQVGRQQADGLIEINDEQFKPWLDRYKYPNRYTDLLPGEPLRHCEEFLAKLEARLERHTFLCGKATGLADMAVYSFVRQFAFVDIDGFRSGSFRAVNQWLERFLASDLFASVMSKHAAWRPGDELRIF